MRSLDKIASNIKHNSSKGGDLLSESPLKILKNLDPGLFKLVEDTSKFALAGGALPRKFKLLIAMGLDASHGSVQGVKSLAQAAIQAGATTEEIMEALRVAQYVSGAGSVYTAAHAFEGLWNSVEES
jgi:alkylhydroperoxidase/carboxymuconolactone decarboxylase family protein YurZ